MTIALVNSIGDHGGNASDVASPAFTSVAGSLIIVSITTYSKTTAYADTEVHDNMGGTYTFVDGHLLGAGHIGSGIWFCTNGSRGAGHVITYSSASGSGTFPDIAVSEFTSTVGWTSPLDTTTHTYSTDAVSPFDVTSLAAIAGSQVGIYVTGNNCGDNYAFTNPAGYSTIYTAPDGGSYNVIHAAYKIGETGTPTVGATRSPSNQTEAVNTFATFKEDAGGTNITGTPATVASVAGTGTISAYLNAAFDAISAVIVKNQIGEPSANGTAAITLAAGAKVAVCFIEASLAGGNSDSLITFPTVTLGGQTMTQVPSARCHSGSGVHGFSDMYYLLNPPTGVQTLAITMLASGTPGNICNLIAFCCSYTGSVQSLGTAKVNNSGGSSGSVTDTLATGDLMVACACNGSSIPTITTGTSRGSQAGDGSTSSHAGLMIADNSGVGSINVTFGLNSGDSSAISGVKLVIGDGSSITAITGTPATVAITAGSATVGSGVGITGTSATVTVTAGSAVLTATTAVTGTSATVAVVSGVGITFPDPVKIADRGVRNNTGTGNGTLAITNPTAIEVGNYLVARVAVDNSGSSGARPGLAFSDSRNGTWTHGTGALQDPGAASAGVATYLCYVKVTTRYQVGDVFSFAWTTGTPRSAIVVEEWANIDQITPLAVAEVQANNVSSTAQPALSRTPTAIGQLMYVAAGIEGFSSYWGAKDSDSTGGSWSDVTKDEANTGTNTTSVSVYGGYKVVTTTDAQTWNNTLGTTSDWAACAVVFAKAVSSVAISGTPATVAVTAGSAVAAGNASVTGTPASVAVSAGSATLTATTSITGTSATVTVISGVGQIGLAGGTITYETSILARVTGAASLTTAFTVTTADFLVVCTSIRDGVDANRPVTGITYNSVPLTKLREDNDNANDITTGIWYLAAPAVGTHNLITTCTGVINLNLCHMIMGLIGVDPTSPVDSVGATVLGSAAQIDLTLTTSTDKAWLVDVIYAKDDTGISVVTTGGHTQQQNSIGGANTDVNAMGTCEKVSAGSQTVSWDNNIPGEMYIGSVVAFKPAAGGGPANITGTSAIVVVHAGSATIGPISVLCPVSISGRKWLDQNSNVYLLKSCSSWSLAENATDAEIDAYLEALVALGFNAVTVSLPGHRGPQTWNWQANQAGQPYWTTTGDNDQWNTMPGTGWASYDHLLTKASELDMVVILSLYTGASDGSGSPPTGNEGIDPVLDWQYARVGSATYLAMLEDIGEAIATRFASYQNIIWHLGADRGLTYGNQTSLCIDAFFHGLDNIEGANRRFRIGEPDCAAIIGQSALSRWDDDFTWFTPISADSVYSYDSDQVTVWDDIYENFTIPVWDCEPPYIEADGSRYNGTPTRLKFRERPYVVFLRNGVGINWGYESLIGFNQGSFYGNDTVAEALASVEMADVSHCWALIDTYCKDLTWVPDSGTFLTTGHGTGVDAAASGHSDTAALVYFPNSRTVVVDTTIISGTGNVQLRWYDPVLGTYSTIAASEAQQSGRSITYPSARGDGTNDWVLVVDTGTNITGTSATVAVHAGVATISFISLLYPHSISGRKILDQNGDVILMRTFSSWGMAVQLTDAQITTQLTKLAALGFNAVTVWTSGRTATGWNEYTTAEHGALFTGTAWQSSLGPGWAAMDWIVSEAARLGMFVNMSFGYGSGGNVAGTEWLSASNAQMQTVGSAVATRYLSYPNIVWHVMIDAAVINSDTAGQRIEALFQGINDVEASARPVRWCEPDNGASTYSQGWLLYGETQFSSNTLYQYHDDSADRFDTVWNESGATTVPVMDCEPPYVGAPHYGGNQRQQLRERTWSVFLRGSWGINFGHEDYWSFGGAKLYGGEWTWDQVLDNSVEVAQQAHIFPVLDGYVADATWAPTSAFVTTGEGTGDTRAAVGASDTSAIAYFPSSRTVTVDTTVIAGTGNVRLRWYNPYDGTFTAIAASEAQQSGRSITYPSAHADSTNDWVLVVDGAGGSVDITGTPATVAVNAGSATLTATTAIVGTSAAVAVHASSATVSGNASVTGTPASVAVSAGSVTVIGQASVIGSSAVVVVPAGSATVTGQTDVTGTSAIVAITAGSGSIGFAASITGTSATVSITAGSAVVTGNADVIGTSANVAVNAGSVVVTGNAAVIGTSANIAVHAGSATIGANTDIAGTFAIVVVHAGSAVLTATTSITGTSATVVVSAGSATIELAISISGSSAVVAVHAGTGTIGVQTDITSTSANVAVHAGTGIVSGDASIIGTSANIAVHAGTGIIGITGDITGISAVVAVIGGTGIIGVQTDILGIGATIVVIAGTGQIYAEGTYILPVDQGAIIIL